MKTTALRIHGEMDLRLDTFDLPELGDDGILAEVVCDSLCMSSYKAAKQGPAHKRVPDNVAETPTIIGHEFSGRLLEVGAKWRHKYRAGDKFGIQPALMYKGSTDAPGYSFPSVGGDATHVRIPSCVMEMECLLPYRGDAFFLASLSEPMSCLIGACRAQYHVDPGQYEHHMGIVEGGSVALLASAGPMGLGLIDYLLHGPRRPALLVVTDIDDARLQRAEQVMSVADARANGVRLVYVNTRGDTAVRDLLDLNRGAGYNDVFVLAPVAPLIEQADALLGRDGCLNFFAGPTDKSFAAKFNFYDVHYSGTHLVGTSGGNTNDIREALDLLAENTINPAMMITHVGGLTSARETTLHLPEIPGGKKLIYTQIDMPLTAISDFAAGAEKDPVFTELADICARHNSMWNLEAEQLVLNRFPRITPN